MATTMSLLLTWLKNTSRYPLVSVNVISSLPPYSSLTVTAVQTDVTVSAHGIDLAVMTPRIGWIDRRDAPCR